MDHDYENIVPHIFTIQVDPTKRDELKKVLETEIIQTGFHYFPNHLLTKFKIDGLSLPYTEKIHKTLVTLPLHPDLKDEDVLFISNTIKNYLNI